MLSSDLPPFFFFKFHHIFRPIGPDAAEFGGVAGARIVVHIVLIPTPINPRISRQMYSKSTHSLVSWSLGLDCLENRLSEEKKTIWDNVRPGQTFVRAGQRESWLISSQRRDECIRVCERALDEKNET